LGVVLIDLELFVAIAEAVEERLASRYHIELAAVQVGERNHGLCFCCLSAEAILAGKRNGLLDHQFLVRKGIARNINEAASDGVEPGPQIFPSTSLRDALFHGFPVCPRCLERGIVLQDITKHLVNGQRCVRARFRVSRLRGHYAPNGSQETCANRKISV